MLLGLPDPDKKDIFEDVLLQLFKYFIGNRAILTLGSGSIFLTSHPDPAAQVKTESSGSGSATLKINIH
jgi:hypothetical protein